MKYIQTTIGLILIGFVGWNAGDRLSDDAVAMALGVLFGFMAVIPMVLMVIAAQGNRADFDQPSPPPRIINNYIINIDDSPRDIMREHDLPWEEANRAWKQAQLTGPVDAVDRREFYVVGEH